MCKLNPVPITKKGDPVILHEPACTKCKFDPKKPIGIAAEDSLIDGKCEIELNENGRKALKCGHLFVRWMVEEETRTIH